MIDISTNLFQDGNTKGRRFRLSIETTKVYSICYDSDGRITYEVNFRPVDKFPKCKSTKRLLEVFPQVKDSIRGYLESDDNVLYYYIRDLIKEINK